MIKTMAQPKQELRRQVLVVEDNNDLSDLLKLHIQDLGCQLSQHGIITLTRIDGSATNGTPAQNTVASANVGQVIAMRSDRQWMNQRSWWRRPGGCQRRRR